MEKYIMIWVTEGGDFNIRSCTEEELIKELTRGDWVSYKFYTKIPDKSLDKWDGNEAIIIHGALILPQFSVSLSRESGVTPPVPPKYPTTPRKPASRKTDEVDLNIWMILSEAAMQANVTPQAVKAWASNSDNHLTIQLIGNRLYVNRQEFMSFIVRRKDKMDRGEVQFAPGNYYTVKDAAEHAGVAEPIIYNWLSERRFPGEVHAGKTYIRRDLFDTFIQSITKEEKQIEPAG